MYFKHITQAFAALLTLHSAAYANDAPSTDNRYDASVFVANNARYKPSLATDKNFVNAWGIAIRPAGAGGHFWITAKDISYEYVGDVTQSADATLQKLHQDKLKIVKLPVGGADKFATSTVFSDSKDAFVITQEIKGAEPITAPSKFLFSSDGGVISAWTERKKADGSFDRSGVANNMIDLSKEGAQFFGLALSHDYRTLYAADFGAQPGIRVFGGDFKPLDITFDQPFDDNKNGVVDAGEYAPFNVQALKTPAGDDHIFVTYAKTRVCPPKEAKKHTCKAGALFAGEEDTSKAGQGRLAEFTEKGKLVAVWDDAGKLSAPWGVAYAPADFGALSGALLVANFGSGTIAAYDAKTHAFIDVVRKTNGKPLVTQGIWGILFGNGQSLGDSNALYFTAGPRDEADGIFGAIRKAK